MALHMFLSYHQFSRAKMGVSHFVCRVALLFSLVVCAPPTCDDHPLYTPELNPVLVSFWTVLESRGRIDAIYLPRYTTHQFAPVSNQSSMIYHGLDLFHVLNYKQPVTDRFIRLHLHRHAKIYLLVGALRDKAHPSAYLPGWKSEGWVQRMDGLKDELEYGVHQTDSRKLLKYGYMFSKVVSASINLPSNEWIERSISGVRVTKGWYVMISERDGTASRPPAQPAAVSEFIVPNKPCPSALHDAWITAETDVSDSDVNDRSWKTWHPQWDPCYWCAYDHEHGSSPLALMSYSPKFEYTSLKNNNEQESNEGFKCAVFQARAYDICFCIHAQTSSLRRVSVRSHTIIFAVAHAKTKELLAEVTHKGFFGFTGKRKKGVGFSGITPEEESMRIHQERSRHTSNKRSVNVLNAGFLEPQALDSDELHGRYETWATNPICSGSGLHGMLNMDIKNPITGIVSPARFDKCVNLGRVKNGKLIRNDGTARLVRFRDFIFGHSHCNFSAGDNVEGASTNGVFYTDATGTVLMSGPSKNSIRQYVKLGFEMQISGKYHVMDPFGGKLLPASNRIGQSSIGYGIDPDRN